VTAELRAPTPGDVPEVARLMSVGFPEPVDEDAVRRMWSRPSFDPALDARIEADAYAFVEPLGEGRVWIDLRGRPTCSTGPSAARGSPRRGCSPVPGQRTIRSWRSSSGGASTSCGTRSA
jgi:hypothetical protein